MSSNSTADAPGAKTKMNFLFVSFDGLIGDIAWNVVKEGHEVRYSIENPDDQEVGAGFVPMVDDWVKMLRSGSDQWFGICLPPLEGSMSFANTPANTSSADIPAARANATSR